MPVIRPAQQGDLNAINDIYNAAIRDSTATFDTAEKTLEERQQWFNDHGPRYSILVAEVDNQVVGWASLSHWNQKPAYDISAETTFYVAVEHRGQGIGRALKAAIIEEARHHDFHSLIALVTAESEASLHLNKMFGFVEVGVLKEIGCKFDRLLDVVILQKRLD